MKKFLVYLSVLIILSGCLGSFKLTRKVYDFNKNVGEKWVNELLFLGMIIIPVYGVATLGDAIIFNSIEFWGGENPIASINGKQMKVVDSKDIRAIMTYNNNTNLIRCDLFKSFRPYSTLIFEKNDSGITVKDKLGKKLYMSSMDNNGGITISNSSGQILKYFSSKEIKSKS